MISLKICIVLSVNKRSFESLMCLDLILLSVIGFERPGGPKDDEAGDERSGR